ncbi:MAG: hypothetical protein JWR85_3467 [Marmoricola sp.]|nr:hypothetical protein [Marmoricola sp.]
MWRRKEDLIRFPCPAGPRLRYSRLAVEWRIAIKKTNAAPKPFKSYEGLTLEGISAQIAHSILVWKTHRLSTPQ